MNNPSAITDETINGSEYDIRYKVQTRNGPNIPAMLITEVLYHITFQTSFQAFHAMIEFIAGWKVPIAIGKIVIIQNRRYVFLFIAKSKILMLINNSDIRIICTSGRYFLTYLISPPW